MISNFSFERGEKVIEKLVGVFVSKSSLHEMFEGSESEIEVCIPQEPEQEEIEVCTVQEAERKELENKESELAVREISNDGGNIHLRSGAWSQYKAVRLNAEYYGAWYQKNDEMVEWIQRHKLAKPVICLGDGHPGVWNIFGMLGSEGERIEILDWYHLKENLYKQSFEKEKLKELESALWNGRTDEVINKIEEGNNFRNYVLEHKKRIINYNYYQQEGITIGSGAVESAIKQINARLNLPGARWKSENVNKMLTLRCIYLNST